MSDVDNKSNHDDADKSSTITVSLTSEIVKRMDEVIGLGCVNSWNEAIRFALFIAIDKYDFIWHKRDWKGQPQELLPADGSGYRILTIKIASIFKRIIDFMVERGAFASVSLFVRNAILEFIEDYRVNLDNYGKIVRGSGRSGQSNGRSGRSGRANAKGMTATQVTELFDAGKLTVNLDDEDKPEAGNEK